jgi:hypothetical protein
LQADIVCNILDKLGRNIKMCSCLLHYGAAKLVMDCRCELQRAPQAQDENSNHFLATRADEHSPNLCSALEVGAGILFSQCGFLSQVMTSLYQELIQAEAGVIRSHIAIDSQIYRHTREGEESCNWDADAEEPEEGDKKRKKKVATALHPL